MKLTIEIDCSQSAQIHDDPFGLGDILRKVAEKLDDYETNAPVSGRIMDDMGRQVGTYTRK